MSLDQLLVKARHGLHCTTTITMSPCLKYIYTGACKATSFSLQKPSLFLYLLTYEKVFSIISQWGASVSNFQLSAFSSNTILFMKATKSLHRAKYFHYVSRINLCKGMCDFQTRVQFSTCFVEKAGSSW